MTDEDNTPQGANSSESRKKFQESIAEYSNKKISAETQEMINKPFSATGTALTEDDKIFLDDLMKKIDDGEINLLTPSSILNDETYHSLDGKTQVKADLFIQSILFMLRQIYDFYHSDHDNDSDMMINMVHDLRLKKESFEKEIGDVLKI